jgi:monofunctional biosynthetic peptidoglycan transglycosylase
MQKGALRRRILTRSIQFAAVFAVGFLIATACAVLILGLARPPASAFMVERSLAGLIDGKGIADIQYRWVEWESISRYMVLAVVAAEDQKFPDHWGFDFESISLALQERKTKGRLRGASTISQQVAKNLFLWNGRSYLRKGLEAYFTVLIELMWSKRRILEVYLNIAEFGDGIYGVGAAAKNFFRKQPSRLSRRESAVLAAVLPNPKKFKVSSPSNYVQGRTRKIEKQMRNLGLSYLERIVR